jgi:hypothetical protein
MANDKVIGSRRHKLRTFLILLPIILIVVGAGVGIYIYVTQVILKTSDGTTSKTTSPSKEKSIATPYSTAEAVAKTEGIDAGQAVLDKELKSTTVPTEQAGIYAAKVALADSNGDGDLAEMISFGLKADEINPTSDSAALLGELYRRSGDKDNAIRFFTLAIQRIGDVSKANDEVQGNYGYYTSSIEAIKNGS